MSAWCTSCHLAYAEGTHHHVRRDWTDEEMRDDQHDRQDDLWKYDDDYRDRLDKETTAPYANGG